MRAMRIALNLALSAFVALPAVAAECPLERAIYRERDQGYELHFFATTNRDPANAGHRFFVVRPGDVRNLSGLVTGNLGVSRDSGTARRDCPTPEEKAPADVTDADWQDCTYWEGLVYALGENSAEMLPMGDEPAPPALLLTDFGRQIRYSGLVGGPGDTPWDVFTFLRCRY
jgi:hypothetical protein